MGHERDSLPLSAKERRTLKLEHVMGRLLYALSFRNSRPTRKKLRFALGVFERLSPDEQEEIRSKGDWYRRVTTKTIVDF